MLLLRHAQAIRYNASRRRRRRRCRRCRRRTFRCVAEGVSSPAPLLLLLPLQMPTSSSCSSTALLSRDLVAFCFVFFLFFTFSTVSRFFFSFCPLHSITKTPGSIDAPTDLSTHHRYRRRPLTSLLRIAPQTSLGRSWPLSRRLSSPRLASPHRHVSARRRIASRETGPRTSCSAGRRRRRRCRSSSSSSSSSSLLLLCCRRRSRRRMRLSSTTDLALSRPASVSSHGNGVSLCDNRARYITHIREQQRAHTYGRDRTRIHPARSERIYTHTQKHTRRVEMRTTGRGRRERTELTVA